MAAAALAPALAALVPLSLRAGASTNWWHPGPLTSWAYVIGEAYPLKVPPIVDGVPTAVEAVDADLGDQDGLGADGAPLPDATIESSVAAVHAMGGRAICYVDAGTAEDWRSDYGEFDPSELGGDVPGWPGEEFIDIADWSAPVPSPYEALQTIMANRISLCKLEGFDAIEADNVDAYAEGDLGDFTLTMSQEETYIDELVSTAHSDGLAFFLKNEVNGDSLLGTEAPLVDGEVDEQCWQYSECSALEIFVQEGKPILNVEYESFPEQVLCPEALAFPMATIQASTDLSGPVNYGCWQYNGATTTTTQNPATTATTKAVTLTTTASAIPAPGPVTTSNVTTTTMNGKVGTPPLHSEAPAFTCSPSAKAFVGRRFLYRVTATGEPAPVFAHSALPKGLHWGHAAKGAATISGVPEPVSAGVREVSLRATNAVGTARQVLTITVFAPARLSVSQPPAAIIGRKYYFVLRASGYPTPTITEKGKLPAGFSLSRAGDRLTLSAAPAKGAAGVYHFSVIASNKLGTDRVRYTLDVRKAPPRQ